MSRMQIFEWHKHFEKGQEEVEDDSKMGQPFTTRTDENITRVKQLVQSDDMLTAQLISDELNRNRESVQTILEGHPVLRSFSIFLQPFSKCLCYSKISVLNITSSP